MPRSSTSVASPPVPRAVVELATAPATVPPDTPATAPLLIGVDVCLATLDVAHNGQNYPVANNQTAIKKWLRKLPDGCSIALESTNTYHQLMADLAFEAGHTVYVLNPQQISHYRPATATRAKTDLCDSRLIARFLEAERPYLRPYKPLCPQLRRLRTLLHRRATIVKTRTQLRLSLGKQAQALELEQPWLDLLQSYQCLIDAIDKQMKAILRTPEFKEQAARLRSIVGFGLLSTSALLTALEHGDFKSSDALVAYFGLDPRPRESGQSHGKTRLSKQGDGEVRRILFNAARAASTSAVWRDYYQRYRDRGLTDIQAVCILARKLVRVAWSMYKRQTKFCPEKITALSA